MSFELVNINNNLNVNESNTISRFILQNDLQKCKSKNNVYVKKIKKYGKKENTYLFFYDFYLLQQAIPNLFYQVQEKEESYILFIYLAKNVMGDNKSIYYF